MGLIASQGDVAGIRIRSVNPGAREEAVIRTPGRQLDDAGVAAMDGVPGRVAPIHLNFLDVVGSSSGALLPTLLPTPHIGYVTEDTFDLRFGDVFDQVNAFAAAVPIHRIYPTDSDCRR